MVADSVSIKKSPGSGRSAIRFPQGRRIRDASRPWQIPLYAILAFLCLPAQSAWHLRLSEHHCEAVYQFQTGYVRLFENAGTRRFREAHHADLERDAPMLEIGMHGSHDGARLGDFMWEWDERDRPLGGDNTHGYGMPFAASRHGNTLPDTVAAEMRLFPDEGQGFFAVDLYASMYGKRYLWTGFDLHERFKVWGTAKETRDDEGVRLPEVRLILRWTQENVDAWVRGWMEEVGRFTHDKVDVEHYLDVPLWRTSNAMNKMERCSDSLAG